MAHCDAAPPDGRINAKASANVMKLFPAFLAIAVSLSGPARAQQVDVGNGSIAETVAKLKAGQYVWAPQVAPHGPMLLIVNTKTQRAVLFRNGVPIAATTVSTGRPGRETPTGVFSVLQKQVVHHSSKYDDAPMPYMQRLTWFGVALHAGHLPGYPASHGCIRMPAGFARLMYGVTTLGMTVVITDHPTGPRIAPTPQIVASGGPTIPSGVSFDWHPEKAPSGPVSIVVSATDQRAVVLRNDVIIGSAPVEIEGRSPALGPMPFATRIPPGSIGSACRFRADRPSRRFRPPNGEGSRPPISSVKRSPRSSSRGRRSSSPRIPCAAARSRRR
jgi:hypothetical protein